MRDIRLQCVSLGLIIVYLQTSFGRDFNIESKDIISSIFLHMVRVYKSQPPDNVLSSFRKPLHDDNISAVRRVSDKKLEVKPTVKMSQKYLTFKPGEEARVKCIVSGQPKPKVIWFKDNVPVQSNNRVSFQDSQRGSTLVIRHLSPTDSGLYRCQAVNVVGRSSLNSTTGVILSIASPTTSTNASVVPVVHNTPNPDACTAKEDDGYCLNGGTCYRVPGFMNGKFCLCPPDYVGDRCEEKRTPYNGRENVSELCDTKKFSGYCLNGGTCRYIRSLSNVMFCVCRSGYIGARCAEKEAPGGAKVKVVPVVHNTPNADVCTANEDDGYCLNGGTCYRAAPNSIYGIFCLCPPDYVGDRCEEKRTPYDGRENISELCEMRKFSGYCLNGGTCHYIRSLSNVMFCVCRSGYKGARCAEKQEPIDPKEKVTDKPHAEPCMSQDADYCLNGGICYRLEALGNRKLCSCRSGYKGARCEEKQTPYDAKGKGTAKKT